ncbi:MAG: TRAP transporter small permease [Spirochaetia bacterium]|nr:TRAP transporter small permease [Spirochaetia bacterium]MCF7953176.1 TRAP transporter small permease [Spirochaetales bacterium]
MFRKISDFISQIEERILGGSIILMAVILIANVIARKLNNSLSYAEEIGAALLTICTFLGIGYAAKKARHIRMSAIFDLFPLRLKKIVTIITSLVTMLLLFYMSYISLQYTQYIKMLGKVTPALRLPAWWISIPLSIGFLLGGIQYLLNIFINLKNPEVYIGTEKIADDVSTETVFDVIEEKKEENGEDN